MTVTPTKLYNGVPGTSNATLYTVPGSTTAVVRQVVVSNTTAGAETITLDLDGTSLCATKSVPANDFIVIDLYQVLDTGDLIEGLQGTGAALEVLISGVLIT